MTSNGLVQLATIRHRRLLSRSVGCYPAPSVTIALEPKKHEKDMHMVHCQNLSFQLPVVSQNDRSKVLMWISKEFGQYRALLISGIFQQYPHGYDMRSDRRDDTIFVPSPDASEMSDWLQFFLKLVPSVYCPKKCSRHSCGVEIWSKTFLDVF